ncbi:MAG: hypothetical protein IPL84_17720 [Chitinophagaceae bacterium]|nr:hypothetical protein [Chitinophagaceae bacterium]
MQLTGGGGGTGTPTQAIFWTASNFGCGPINVTCNGVTKQITSYTSSAPSCGSAGFATFSLGYGTYSFTASCSGYSWSGTVSTTPGACTKTQLTLSGGGGGGGGCGGQITAYGSVVGVSTPLNVWTSWYKVADVGNGAVYISFKLFGCSGPYVIGYPKYRIQNTCTNIPICRLSFKFEWADCGGVKYLETISGLALNSAYIDEDPGLWFLGKNVTQSYVPSSVKLQ